MSYGARNEMTGIGPPPPPRYFRIIIVEIFASHLPFISGHQFEEKSREEVEKRLEGSVEVVAALGSFLPHASAVNRCRHQGINYTSPACSFSAA